MRAQGAGKQLSSGSLRTSGDYILEVEQGPAEAIIANLVSLDPSRKQTIMIAAQQLRQQGMQQGMQQEKLGIAKEMLQDNMPKEKISMRWYPLFGQYCSHAKVGYG